MISPTISDDLIISVIINETCGRPSGENITVLFLDLLEGISVALNNGYYNHFVMKDHNVLDELLLAESVAMGNKIKRFVMNPVSCLENLNSKRNMSGNISSVSS